MCTQSSRPRNYAQYIRHLSVLYVITISIEYFGVHRTKFSSKLLIKEYLPKVLHPSQKLWNENMYKEKRTHSKMCVDSRIFESSSSGRLVTGSWQLPFGKNSNGETATLCISIWMKRARTQRDNHSKNFKLFAVAYLLQWASRRMTFISECQCQCLDSEYTILAAKPNARLAIFDTGRTRYKNGS